MAWPIDQFASHGSITTTTQRGLAAATRIWPRSMAMTPTNRTPYPMDKFARQWFLGAIASSTEPVVGLWQISAIVVGDEWYALLIEDAAESVLQLDRSDLLTE